MGPFLIFMENKILELVEKINIPSGIENPAGFLQLEILPEEDKNYFGLIIQKIHQDQKILFHPKINFNDILKGIILNIGLHVIFHENFSQENQNYLRNFDNIVEFKLTTKLFILNKLNSLQDSIKTENFNYENLLTKTAYGFISLNKVTNDFLSERLKIERAIIYQLYYDSIIKKSWWGFEIDVLPFYQKLEELHFWPEKKIKKLINEGGYFTLEALKI